MNPQPFHSSPYKGLVPYTEEDAQFFFGRETIRDIIIDNLQTWRLTLVYGASGVGKSSVLFAGVVPRLRQMAQQGMVDNQRGTPEFSVITFNSWRDDPVAGLARTIQERLTEFLDVTDQPSSPPPTLMAALDRWTAETDAELYIILDQFEEYFQYHGQSESPGTLAAELPRAVLRSGQRINFLISIREDALAKLDLFKRRLPDLFAHILRVRPLTVEEARKAIEAPIEQYNALSRTLRLSIEQQLLEAVLQSVKRTDVTADRIGVTPGAAHVDAAILQQVMMRLWEEDVERSGLNVLRFATFQRLGGAEKIVSTHFSSTMEKLSAADQKTAAAIFRYLVTPSGTKIAQTAADLAAYSELPHESVSSVLEKLSSSDLRILRAISPPPDQKGEVRYEIFHDVLSSPINDWRRGYEAEARVERARLEAIRDREIVRARYSRRVAVVLSVMLVMVSGLTIYAFQQKALALGQRALAAESAENERNAKVGEEDAKKKALELAGSEKIARENAEEQARKATEAEKKAVDARNQALEALDIADKRRREMEAARTTDRLYREAFRQSRRKDQREEAIKNFKKALDVYLKSTEPLDQQAATDTYINIGEVYVDLGDEAAASKSFQDALARCKTNPNERAAALTNIGNAYKEVDPWSLGFEVDPRRIASDKYSEALSIYRNKDDATNEAAVLISLGQVRYQIAGPTRGEPGPEHEEAFRLVERAIELYRAQKDHKGQGFALFTLADIKAQAQQYYSSALPQAVFEKLEQALKEYEAASDIQGQIMVRKRLIRLFNPSTQPAKVLENLSAIASLYKELKDKAGLAATLGETAAFNLKRTRPGSNEYAQFMSDYRKAAELYEEAERPDQAAQTWMKIGNYYQLVNRTSETAESFEKAAKLFHRVGNRQREVFILYELSTLFSQTDNKKALSYLDQLSSVVEELDKREKAQALFYLGDGFLSLKDLVKASTYFEQGLTIYHQLQDVPSEIFTLERISNAYLDRSMFDDSIRYLDRVLLMYQSNAAGQARTYMSLGSVQVKKGKPHDAIQYYQRAATLYKEQKYASEQAKALLELGKIYYSESLLDKAISTLESVRQLFESYPISQISQGTVLMQLAQSYQGKKDLRKAIESYEEAAKFYNKSNLGGDESKALTAISAIYEVNGDPKNAEIYKLRAEKAAKTPSEFGPPQP